MRKTGHETSVHRITADPFWFSRRPGPHWPLAFRKLRRSRNNQHVRRRSRFLRALPATFPISRPVAAQAVKGVVNISSVTVTQAPRSPFADDPFFQYFFGGQEEMFGGRDRRDMSLGSGVLVSTDGYVVTNNHVVRSAKAQVTVAFGDKHEVPARIIGTDPATDIALLKIAPGAAPMPAMMWGDSSKLKVAEWVLAIGSPYQLNQTVTLGIVSALGRTNVGFSEYEDFIQTDAAINPGNSAALL
jgi:S1-C subfamily serine protease